MTIPAGWYDDGSGTQRWWDGSGWTTHTVTSPAAERPAEPAQPVQAPAAQTGQHAASEAHGEAPATAADTFAPPYVLPGQAPAQAPGPAVGGVPHGATQQQGPGWTSTPPSGAGWGGTAAPGAAWNPPASLDTVGGHTGSARRPRISVLGIIGLSVTALGVILSCIPLVSMIGWILLGVGFVASLVSIFLPGAKWPGITGMALAGLGGVLAVAVALLTVGVPGAPETADDPTPVSTPGARPSDDPDPVPSPAQTPAEGTETVTFAELEVGQCLPFIEWDEEVYELPIVPCDQPHTDEVYLIFDMPDGEFPGDDALQAAATERCESAFGEFVGLPYADSVLDMYWFVPTEASWNRWNDRAIQCIAFSYDEVTGTLEGAAR